MKLKTKYIKRKTSERIYGLNIPIVALTGGIATGKSTVSNILIQKGVPLLDADKLVKLVYQKEITKTYLKRNLPQVINEEEINFRKLREIFFSQKKVKEEIESLIYSELPEVFKEELIRLNDPSFIFYDIPLLFEKNLDTKFDLSILVYADQETQISRLMKRDNHSREEAYNIINQQISIEEKKKKADLTLLNTKDLFFIESQVSDLMSQLFDF